MNLLISVVDMKQHTFFITMTSSIVAILAIGAVAGMNATLMLLLTLAGQISLVFMVIAILKAPHRVDKTFDEYFYQDSDIKRDASPTAQR